MIAPLGPSSHKPWGLIGTIRPVKEPHDVLPRSPPRGLRGGASRFFGLGRTTAPPSLPCAACAALGRTQPPRCEIWGSARFTSHVPASVFRSRLFEVVFSGCSLKRLLRLFSLFNTLSLLVVQTLDRFRSRPWTGRCQVLDRFGFLHRSRPWTASGPDLGPLLWFGIGQQIDRWLAVGRPLDDQQSGVFDLLDSLDDGSTSKPQDTLQPADARPGCIVQPQVVNNRGVDDLRGR